MTKWGVVFDLDETLVLTSAIEPLRTQRKWREAHAAFPQTVLPQGTERFLIRLAQHAHLGVVTKAPRHYAEALLKHHGIRLDVLVAYHDVKRVKPDPEGLILASRKLGIVPSKCIYIGDDANDITAARAAGFQPVGVCWGEETNIGLESVCKSWDEVYETILQMIQTA